MQYLDNMAKQLISESKLATIIEESIKRHLNEAFKSSKLKNFAREHGGLVQGNWSSSFGNDLFNMSDEDFDQYVPVDKEEHYRRYGMGGWDRNSTYNNNNFQPLEFKDGTFLVRKDPETAYGQKSKDLYGKRSDRYDAKKDDGAKEYQYENPYLHSLVNDTEFKPRGNWGFKGEGDLEKQNLNPKAIKQKHIFSTYGDDAFKKADDLAAGKFKEKNDDKNIVNKTRLSSKRNGKKSDKA